MLETAAVTADANCSRVTSLMVRLLAGSEVTCAAAGGSVSLRAPPGDNYLWRLAVEDPAQSLPESAASPLRPPLENASCDVCRGQTAIKTLERVEAAHLQVGPQIDSPAVRTRCGFAEQAEQALPGSESEYGIGGEP